MSSVALTLDCEASAILNRPALCLTNKGVTVSKLLEEATAARYTYGIGSDGPSIRCKAEKTDEILSD
jgi:hypothetical protein